MQLSAKHDIQTDPATWKPIPTRAAFQPALRADVSRAGANCDPGALSCSIFDIMVHPVFK